MCDSWRNSGRLKPLVVDLRPYEQRFPVRLLPGTGRLVLGYLLNELCADLLFDEIQWADRMPAYCPELNPDELLSQDVKTNGLGTSRPTERTELMAIMHSHLYWRQKQPQVMQSLFREEHAQYVA